MPRVKEKADIEIANLIKARRLAKGMTQTQLASKLGLTFQQIQKYENGVNRVSAGRLFQIAEVLGVDVTFFREGDAGGTKGAMKEIGKLLSTPGAIQLVRAYNKIKKSSVRKMVVNL